MAGCGYHLGRRLNDSSVQGPVTHGQQRKAEGLEQEEAPAGNRAEYSRKACGRGSVSVSCCLALPAVVHIHDQGFVSPALRWRGSVASRVASSLAIQPPAKWQGTRQMLLLCVPPYQHKIWEETGVAATSTPCPRLEGRHIEATDLGMQAPPINFAGRWTRLEECGYHSGLPRRLHRAQRVVGPTSLCQVQRHYQGEASQLLQRQASFGLR